MQLTTNFTLQEFVHPYLWLKFGPRIYSALNPLLLQLSQELRDEFGPIIINDWPWELEENEIDDHSVWQRCFTDSGLRRLCGGVGAEYSAHRLGFAADMKFSSADPIEVQQHILRNQEAYPSIIRMENAEITRTWLHIEVGRRTGEIIVFNP